MRKTLSRRQAGVLARAISTRSATRAKLPAVEIAAEDYRRLARMAKIGRERRCSRSTSDVRYLDDDSKAYNIIADIPGTDPKAGYVMAGAHFDSWVAGDGASDNGAGSVVGDGGGADPAPARRAAEADDPFRPVGGRGAGAARLAPITCSSILPAGPAATGPGGVDAYYSWARRVSRSRRCPATAR